jgi:flagellar motor switch/type III secretory pathway protein FliN
MSATGQGHTPGEAAGDVESFDWRRVLRSLDPLEARYANGFLRCHPEKWFPGIGPRWSPVLSALGSDLRVGEIKPTLVLPDAQAICFKAIFGGEAGIVAIDPNSARLIAQEIAPGVTNPKDMSVVLEYVVQRFMAIVGMCQAGTDVAAVEVDGRCSSSDAKLVGSVKISFSLNSSPLTVLIGVGERVADMMDGLWRRQLHAAARAAHHPGMLRVEVAQLGVPPQMLSEYLLKGTVIDLEVPVSEAITLRIGHKAFMPARLVEVEGRLGCQIIQGSLSNLAVPDGTSRLSIEIASLAADAARLSELGQVGSVLVLDMAPGQQVSIVINQEKVADAKLCVYQGRFAVEVL